MKANKRVKVLLGSKKSAFHTGETLKAGIHPRTLYKMRDQGVIERLGRGMYRFADARQPGSGDSCPESPKRFYLSQRVIHLNHSGSIPRGLPRVCHSGERDCVAMSLRGRVTTEAIS